MKHADYMEKAIAEATLAAALGEVPVGCVIVKNGEIIAAGHNTRETEKSALGHAEINAIDAACRALNSWRLSGCTLYVTLEPCPMCMGAMLNARIDRLVFGAIDSKAGCCGSIVNLNAVGYPHTIDVLGSICEEKCQAVLKDFFCAKRRKTE